MTTPADEPAGTPPERGGVDPEFSALADRVAAVLLPGVLDRSSELAGALGRLSYDFEANPDVPEAWAERELSNLQEQSFAGGWWLAVLTSALGSNGVGSRRERRGLRGLDLILRPACAERGVELGFTNELADLGPDFGAGWRVPFLGAALAVEALNLATGTLELRAAGRRIELGIDGAAPDTAELDDRCRAALAVVPGCAWEPSESGAAGLVLPEAAFDPGP